MKNSLKILAYQPLITGIKTVEDRRSHVRRLVQVLDLHCRRERDIALILLPELTTIDYSSTSFDKLTELAEPLKGETFKEMSSLAERVGCAISYGFPQEADDHYLITQVTVGSSGQFLTTYSKLHLAHFGDSMEQDYFSRGERLSVFELGGFRFGTIICYDFRFSELIKQLVVRHGADVILHPVAFARDSSYASWHHFVVSRALEYQTYFLSINRAGQAYGSSIICPPWIDERTSPTVLGDEEEACIFTLDKQVIHAVRETYPFRRDMLADYSVLRIADSSREAGERKQETST